MCKLDLDPVTHCSQFPQKEITPPILYQPTFLQNVKKIPPAIPIMYHVSCIFVGIWHMRIATNIWIWNQPAISQVTPRHLPGWCYQVGPRKLESSASTCHPGVDIVLSHYGSMGLVYLPTFAWICMVNVGIYCMPCIYIYILSYHPMGINSMSLKKGVTYVDMVSLF